MTYTLTVNYDTSIKDLIKKGKYNYVNSDITEVNFPSEEKGESKIEVELLGFSEPISSIDVLKEMKLKGLQALTLKELLHLGIKYPDLQRWIVALGSRWHCPDGDVRVPGLYGGSDRRGLSFFWFGGDWDPYWRFAARRVSSVLKPLPKTLKHSDTLTLSEVNEKLDRIIKYLGVK